MWPFSAETLTETLSHNFSRVMAFLLEPRTDSQNTGDLLVVNLIN